ncbi:hypothetical protein I7X12_15570 [Halosimplex litoreum]|uniref:DUF7344 domain-containing protein n=1 Tax=Halosimplex litoreum TaxID=1198301 RepID=A0A7T3FWT9_9EURY|nr:hypothetical protein [Halosimplex litoreum]QPV62148.1 hypothetical protein I7X12_15570 [Halosimplex litoreum]
MSETMTEIELEYAATDELNDDERYRIFADRRRRLTLAVLDERTTPIDLQELASQVVARGEGSEADDAGLTEAAIELHHKHLPMMDALGVLEYDPAERCVEP